MKSTHRKRIIALDVIRVLAITSVLICHACEQAFPQNGGSAPMAILHSLGRQGVPFFLFLSGALLLNKNYTTNEDILAFYKKSLLPLLLTVEAWIAIYSCFLWLTGQDFNTFDYIKCALFINNIPMMHWWYIPTILMIYIAMPFISRALNSISLKASFVPLATTIFLGFVLPTINGFTYLLIGKELHLTFDIAPLGGIYVCYVVLGHYFINKRILSSMSIARLITLFLIGAAGSSAQEYLGLGIWYSSLFVLLTSAAITEIILRFSSRQYINEKLQAKSKQIELLSRISFAIYFIHVPALYFIQKLSSALTTPWTNFAISFLGMMLISCAISITLHRLLQRAPKIRNLLLNS